MSKFITALEYSCLGPGYWCTEMEIELRNRQLFVVNQQQQIVYKDTNVILDRCPFCNQDLKNPFVIV